MPSSGQPSFLPFPPHPPTFLTKQTEYSFPHLNFFFFFLCRRVNVSVSRRQMLSLQAKDQASSCITGNPIDDCWACDPDWQKNRQRLADCGIGFGHNALGGKGGQIYVVTDSSDGDPANPVPGTLRHAVIQEEPLWYKTQSYLYYSIHFMFWMSKHPFY
jgi:hypothetical protein